MLSDLQTVEIRKADIEENQVWLKVLRKFEGLSAVGSLANDLKARISREDRQNRGADLRIIVHY